MASFTNRQKFRVGGSGFTAFYWKGKPIAFAQRVTHTSPQTIASPVPIQPLDARYPLQIITPGAVKEGYLEIEMMELYNKKVWDAMIDAAYGDKAPVANDLADVFFALASVNEPINAAKVIIPPQNLQGNQSLTIYGEVYHNCVITNIDDSEAIDVRSMEVVKRITVSYTHMTRSDKQHLGLEKNPMQPTYGRILDNYSDFA